MAVKITTQYYHVIQNGYDTLPGKSPQYQGKRLKVAGALHNPNVILRKENRPYLVTIAVLSLSSSATFN